MAGSIYFDGEWFNFDGFAVVLLGEGQVSDKRVEIVPSGLFPAVTPVSHPDNILSLTVGVAAGKLSGESTFDTNLSSLFELLRRLEQWDADRSNGFDWDCMPDARIRLQRTKSTQGWELHYYLSDNGNAMQGAFPLDRGCIASVRNELAAIVRCINAAEI